MERLFWVECPDCHGRFYCDWGIRHAGFELHCPFCQKTFKAEEAPWIDERP